MDATKFFPMLGAFILICLAVWLLAGIVFLIIMLAKLIKRRLIGATFCYLWTIFCIFAIGASWIMNMGWIRFFLTIFLVPLIHLSLLGGLNGMVLLWLGRELKAKLLSVFSCLSGLGVHLLLPDGGDYGDSYFFFSLVQSDQAADIVGVFCDILIIVHLAILILQFVSIIRFRIKKSKQTSEQAI